MLLLAHNLIEWLTRYLQGILTACFNGWIIDIWCVCCKLKSYQGCHFVKALLMVARQGWKKINVKNFQIIFTLNFITANNIWIVLQNLWLFVALQQIDNLYHILRKASQKKFNKNTRTLFWSLSITFLNDLIFREEIQWTFYKVNRMCCAWSWHLEIGQDTSVTKRRHNWVKRCSLNIFQKVW